MLARLARRAGVAGLRWRWEVKWEDCWVGLFWRDDPPFALLGSGGRFARRHAWICLVPCLPLHVSWLVGVDDDD